MGSMTDSKLKGPSSLSARPNMESKIENKCINERNTHKTIYFNTTFSKTSAQKISYFHHKRAAYSHRSRLSS